MKIQVGDKLTVDSIEQLLNDPKYRGTAARDEVVYVFGAYFNRNVILEELEELVRSMLAEDNIRHDAVCASSHEEYDCGDKGWEDCDCDLIKIRDLLKEL